MFDLVALRDNLGSLRLAIECACDRFLHGAIVEVLDLLVVGRLPVNENADADEDVVGLILRNDALGHAIGDWTACWAGPNICRACLAPLIVTLLNSTVAGLQSRFGATTASSDVKPSLLFVRQRANAVSAALPRGPMMRSI